MKTATTIFLSVALFTLASLGTAFAGSITKTFEFGPGTQYSSSAFRTFPGVPCLKPVAVTVKFRTSGPAGASNEVPIRIELRQPGSSPDGEGPVVEFKNTTAKPAEQTITLSSPGNDRSCSLAWRVRVNHLSAGAAPFLTLGSIKLDFDTAVRNLTFPGPGNLSGNNPLTINIGSSGGLEQGTIVLTGDWVHKIAPIGGEGVEGPNPIKLKIQLIAPGDFEVKSAEGYANRQSERNQGLPILKLIYQVTACTPGQWKLRIRNLDTNDDVYVHKIDETFTPACP